MSLLRTASRASWERRISSVMCSKGVWLSCRVGGALGSLRLFNRFWILVIAKMFVRELVKEAHTHSHTHTLTHLHTHSLTHSHIHPLTHSHTHTPTHSHSLTVVRGGLGGVAREGLLIRLNFKPFLNKYHLLSFDLPQWNKFHPQLKVKNNIYIHLFV